MDCVMYLWEFVERTSNLPRYEKDHTTRLVHYLHLRCFEYIYCHHKLGFVENTSCSSRIILA